MITLTDLPQYSHGACMNQEKKLVRILTCGSVDNGKSTLIGRLMLDAKALMEDQIASVAKSQFSRGDLDLAMFTDGLTEERERGITIDVAYRYFSTPTHKFILADCPGHAEYTRNMATGASNSDIALILVDPNYVIEHGKLEDQTKLHYRICQLFGLATVFVINKADTLAWNYAKIDKVEGVIAKFTCGVHGGMVAVSALIGDNVTTPRDHGGLRPSLMGLILHLADNAADEVASGPLCIAIQSPCRLTPSVGIGNVLSGAVNVGDVVIANTIRSLTEHPQGPTALSTSVQSLTILGKPTDTAVAGDAIEIGVSRNFMMPPGAVITSVDNLLERTWREHATLVWMSDTSLIPEDTRYIFKSQLGSSLVSIDQVGYVMDPTTGIYQNVQHYSLMTNDIGKVELRFSSDVLVPQRNDSPGLKFILIDQQTGDTVAAGFIG